MTSSYRIAELSFGRSHWDGSYDIQFAGKHFSIHRMGTEFSVENMKALIHRYRNDVDAFALSNLPPIVNLNGKSYVHGQYLDIMSTPSSAPLCDGTGLREISNLSSLISLVEAEKINTEKGIFFPAAVMCMELEEYLRKNHSAKLFLGDAYASFGLPLMIKPFPGLMTLAKWGLNLSGLKEMRSNTPMAKGLFQKASRSALLSQLEQVQYVVADLGFLLLFEGALDVIRDKDIVTWSHHPRQMELLHELHPKSVIQLFPEKFNLSPYMNYSVLEALLRLHHGRSVAFSIDDWFQLLETELHMNPLVRKFAFARSPSFQTKVSAQIHQVRKKVSKIEKTYDFAFVAHALSRQDFARIPGLKQMMGVLPERYNDRFDHAVSSLPSFVYGDIQHIVSESTGREVNGLIYGLFSTPKVMKLAPPEETYLKIERICEDAASRGAKIIGLGAYTKVVGDSGITINRNSPIPVTTGNSLSASATLWGLYDIVKKMNLLKIHPETGRVQAVAAVIGATGSIGSVSAKMLALVFDEIYLVAPRLQRLQELATEIQNLSPQCKVHISTNANEVIARADVLVTATSSVDQSIVDVMKLKPGCVVCDCSRPLDFTMDDAKKRPDVLIIESGEVVLPGPYHMSCDLGLPKNTVYACLAETALLALEQRFESFTLGRDIDWIKVKEIYKMAKKHGVRLSAIQGHAGFVTETEIQLIREKAMQQLK